MHWTYCKKYLALNCRNPNFLKLARNSSQKNDFLCGLQNNIIRCRLTGMPVQRNRLSATRTSKLEVGRSFSSIHSNHTGFELPMNCAFGANWEGWSFRHIFTKSAPLTPLRGGEMARSVIVLRTTTPAATHVSGVCAKIIPRGDGAFRKEEHQDMVGRS